MGQFRAASRMTRRLRERRKRVFIFAGAAGRLADSEILPAYETLCIRPATIRAYFTKRNALGQRAGKSRPSSPS
jgi:hypothetical protein